MSQGQSVKFLSGKNIYLRTLEPEDLEFIYKGVFSSESRRLTGTQHLYSKAGISAYIAGNASDSTRVGMLICLQQSNEPVGEVVLNNIDFINRSANIRIAIFDEKNYSQGCGTQALLLMLVHAFGGLNLHRVELGVFDFNARAIHVYEKLGFKREGVLRDSLYYNHRYHNQILMSIVEDEYRQLYLLTE